MLTSTPSEIFETIGKLSIVQGRVYCGIKVANIWAAYIKRQSIFLLDPISRVTLRKLMN